MSAYSGQEALDVLDSLIETVEATGGLTQLPDGMYALCADEAWIDLAHVYIQACAVLGRIPRVDAYEREG